jgi:hypothetical protein
MLSGKSSGLTSLQKEMQRLLDRQKQALERVCPHCWGSLEKESLIVLRCSACDRIYYVEDLIKGAIK